jgi:hypothetical protein
MAREQRSPKVAEQSGVCPMCGGALEFESDRLGYGQTLEYCVNWQKCGHFRTLEKIVQPAHTPAPRGQEKPRPGSSGDHRQNGARRVNRMAAPGSRRCNDETYERILALLPADEAAAIMAPSVAVRAGISPSLAVNVLGFACREGRVRKRNLPKTQALGRPPVGYWRCA